MWAREVHEWQLQYGMNPIGEDADNIRTALLLMPHVDPKRRSRTELWHLNPLIPEPPEKRLNADATESAFDALFGLGAADVGTGKAAC